jgi:hypothetical protein
MEQEQQVINVYIYNNIHKHIHNIDYILYTFIKE